MISSKITSWNKMCQIKLFFPPSIALFMFHQFLILSCRLYICKAVDAGLFVSSTTLDRVEDSPNA